MESLVIMVRPLSLELRYGLHSSFLSFFHSFILVVCYWAQDCPLEISDPWLAPVVLSYFSRIMRPHSRTWASRSIWMGFRFVCSRSTSGTFDSISKVQEIPFFRLGWRTSAESEWTEAWARNYCELTFNPCSENDLRCLWCFRRRIKILAMTISNLLNLS
jgi:hypothetical protein